MLYSFTNLFSNLINRYYRIMMLAAVMVIISGLIPGLTIYADGPVVDMVVDENDGICASDDCSLGDTISTANTGNTRKAQKQNFSDNDAFVINGKSCEVLVEMFDDSRKAYKRNPDISDKEWNECRILIKQQSTTAPYVPDEILVVFNGSDRLQNQMVEAHEVFAATIDKVEERPGWVLVKLNSNTLNTQQYRDTVQQAITTLKDDPRVKWVGPNYLAKKLDAPYSWGLDFMQGYDSQIPCDSSVGIAYIDTGIRLDHSEFGLNTYYGWNFVADTPDAMDDEGHGTYVASLGSGLNLGTCPGATTVAYKALDNLGSGSHDDIAQAVISATNNSQVDFISMSLGGVSSSVLETAIANSTKLIFVATGNGLGDDPEYPARYAETYDHVIPIGAIDENARIATFSNRFKSCLTCGVVAPGVNIVGADYLDANGFIVASGTSASTPFVAGLAASLKSYNATLTNNQIRDLILTNAVELGDSREYSNGVINMPKVLNQAGMSIEIKPIVVWPLPWPGSSIPDEPIQLLAKIPVGTPAAVSSTIEFPDGLTQTVDMQYNPSVAHWQAVYTPTVTGTYSFTISSHGRSGFDINNFYVVEVDSTGEWPQFGQQSENGSYLPYTLVITSATQIYNQWNDIGAGSSDSVVAQLGRAIVPSAVRIVGGCSFGEYGQVFNYDPDIGVYSGYTDLYSTTLRLSCQHGMGMFPESGVFGENLYIPDEGGSINNWDGRIHSVNPESGEQYWLTQIGYHQHGDLKLSPDGLIVYSPEGTYAGLRALDALTGERLWYYHPYQYASISAPPALENDTVYVLIEGSNPERGLHALGAQSGSILWKYTADIRGNTSPLVMGNMVIFCGENTLYAVNKNSGNYIWSTTIGNQNLCNSSPARIGQNHLVAYMRGSGGNYLHLLNAQTGSALAQIKVVDYGSNASSPAVIGDHVFLTDYDGMISAYQINLDTPTLTNVWSDEVDPYSLSSWQTSGLVGEDAQGQYVLVTAAGNNGFLKAWKFRVIEKQISQDNHVYLPVILKND